MSNTAHEHIITLSVNCKEATGDGQKIVCMNSDYKVRITTEQCPTFVDSDIKKLIVRHGKEYYEVDIEEKTDDDGTEYLQADLPPIGWKDFVYLGVYGKDTGDTAPKYTSTSAKFDCENSVLNGVVVLKNNKKLTDRTIIADGTYRALDEGYDGYNVVTVQTASMIAEEITAPVQFTQAGIQEIIPPNSHCLLSKVTLLRPDELTPDNVRVGVNIAGTVGTYGGVQIYEGELTVVSIEEV